MGIRSNVLSQLSSQPLIGQVFRVNNTAKGVSEDMVVVPVVVPPFKLFEVAV